MGEIFFLTFYTYCRWKREKILLTSFDIRGLTSFPSFKSFQISCCSKSKQLDLCYNFNKVFYHHKQAKLSWLISTRNFCTGFHVWWSVIWKWKFLSSEHPEQVLLPNQWCCWLPWRWLKRHWGKILEVISDAEDMFRLPHAFCGCWYCEYHPYRMRLHALSDILLLCPSLCNDVFLKKWCSV